MKLEDLAFKLNTIESSSGARFAAEYSADTDTLKVTCDINPEAMIFMVQSDEQIISVTPLFGLDEIEPEAKSELFETLLRISPVVPLSSIGLQENNCVLFGAMPVNTLFENIAHELECQADNYSDVLIALDSFFKKIPETEEV